MGKCALSIASNFGRLGKARENYQNTVEFCRRLLAIGEKIIQIRLNLARSYGRLGQSILRSGSLGDTLANYEESLKIYQTLAAENPSEEKFERSVGYILAYIEFTASQKQIIALKFTADGKTLISTDTNGKVNFWSGKF